MVVVLPTPLTPINRATDGAVSSLSSGSPTWSMSVSTWRRHARAPSMSLIVSAFTRRRSSSTAFMVVSTPMSPRISVSSSSS